MPVHALEYLSFVDVEVVAVAIAVSLGSIISRSLTAAVFSSRPSASTSKGVGGSRFIAKGPEGDDVGEKEVQQALRSAAQVAFFWRWGNAERNKSASDMIVSMLAMAKDSVSGWRLHRQRN